MANNDEFILPLGIFDTQVKFQDNIDTGRPFNNIEWITTDKFYTAFVNPTAIDSIYSNLKVEADPKDPTVINATFEYPITYITNDLLVTPPHKELMDAKALRSLKNGPCTNCPSLEDCDKLNYRPFSSANMLVNMGNKIKRRKEDARNGYRIGENLTGDNLEAIRNFVFVSPVEEVLLSLSLDQTNNPSLPEHVLQHLDRSNSQNFYFSLFSGKINPNYLHDQPLHFGVIVIFRGLRRNNPITAIPGRPNTNDAICQNCPVFNECQQKQLTIKDVVRSNKFPKCMSRINLYIYGENTSVNYPGEQHYATWDLAHGEFQIENIARHVTDDKCLAAQGTKLEELKQSLEQKYAPLR